MKLSSDAFTEHRSLTSWDIPTELLSINNFANLRMKRVMTPASMGCCCGLYLVLDELAIVSVIVIAGCIVCCCFIRADGLQPSRQPDTQSLGGPGNRVDSEEFPDAFVSTIPVSATATVPLVTPTANADNRPEPSKQETVATSLSISNNRNVQAA